MRIPWFGALGALFVWLSSVAGASAQPATSAVLDNVLSASRAALGLRALPAIHTLHQAAAGTIVGIAGTGEQWQDLQTGTFTQSIAAGPLTGANGYDGSHAWNEDQAGIVYDDGSLDARYNALDAAYMNRYALWLPDRGGATVTLGARQSAAGKTYDVVTVTPPQSLPFDVWIDTQTYLPWKMIQKIGTMTTTTTTTDYHAVGGGLQIPYSTVSENEQGSSSLKVTSIDLDAADAPAHLARPISHATDFSIAGGAETSVPFELIDNHVYVPVYVNGKGPYRFIFDTGASNVLDSTLAKDLALNGQGSIAGQGVGAATENFNFGKVRTLSIGKATLTDQAFAYAPVRAGFGVSASLAPDGLIGSDVLARFDTTFDYARKVVTLRMPASADLPGTRVPFRFHGTTPAIDCVIGNQPGTCTVDTGSRISLSVLAPFIAAHPSLVPANATQVGANGFGVGGASLGRLGRATLQIGGYTLPDLITDFSVQQKGAFADPFTAGNIGGGVWQRFTLRFDYAHETLSLLPNDSLNVHETYDRSGLFLVNRPGEIVVADVRPGTPGALAGIARGERISVVNGHAVTDLGVMRQLLRGAAGTTLQIFVVGKDGAPRQVTLVLRDYV